MVRSALRRATASLFEDLGSFFLANVVLATVLVVTALARPAPVLAVLVGALAVPVMCGMCRMAASAVRDIPVRPRQLLEGGRHRFWVHLGLGATQTALLLIAVLNLNIAVARGGLLNAASAVVSIYVVVVVTALATATWPLLLDPERADRPWPQLLGLAVRLAVQRPLPLLAAAVIAVALAAVTAQAVIPVLVVPGFVVLLSAHLVLPAADAREQSSV